MNNLSKSAFITMMALVCYAGFATAQVVSLDSLADVSTLVKDLKSGGPGGHGGHGGGHVPTPPPPSHNGGGHSGGFGDHNGPGNHGGDHNGPGNNGWDHNGPGNNGGNHNGPGPNPWHPQPQPWNPGPQPWHPQPQPWNPGTQPWNPGTQPWNPQPGPQPGPWHPHHNGHPDWDNNDWNNNQWNHHGPNHNTWWNNYDYWWNSSSHPYSAYRTACVVIPGVSAKGFILEQTLPFYGTATFYFYDAFDRIVGASSPVNGVYRGGDGTPLFDFYQVPRADHCFLAITR